MPAYQNKQTARREAARKTILVFAIVTSAIGNLLQNISPRVKRRLSPCLSLREEEQKTESLRHHVHY